MEPANGFTLARARSSGLSDVVSVGFVTTWCQRGGVSSADSW